MQSNNTLDGTNTTADGADISAFDSRPQKAGAKSDLRSLSSEQILELVTSLGQPKFRAKQIEEWIWSKGATSFDQMSNLPKTLREELSKQVTLAGAEQIVRQVSEDGSRKYLLRYPDGTSVECVGMPTGNKLSVCASTQAGCAMGCAFCATALLVSRALFLRARFTSRLCTSATILTHALPALFLWVRASPS